MALVVSLKISGSFSFSAAVNLPSTKLVSPVFWRIDEPVPSLSLGNSLVPSSEMVDFKPLLPPAEPFSRRRSLPNSRLKSSQMIKMSLGLIL